MMYMFFFVVLLLFNDVFVLCVLIVDDDVVSCCFLFDVVCVFGVDVIDCVDGVEVLGVVWNEMFDLLLLDCCMFGVGVCEILVMLCKDVFVVLCDVVVIVIIVEFDIVQCVLLLVEGFSDVFVKLCCIDDLWCVVVLVFVYLNCLLVFDDEVVLLVSGDLIIMCVLCQLLQQELLMLCSEFDQFGQDGVVLCDCLYCLCFLCGFCGVIVLLGYVVVLQ